MKKETQRIWSIVLQAVGLAICIAAITLSLVWSAPKKQVNEKSPISKTLTYVPTINEQKTLFVQVYDYIFSLRIEHPDIVMAQCLEESGNFTSDIFLEGNNCVGMKVPKTRPTTAIGVVRGHAEYNSWQECILDYAIWQSTFCRRLTREEYFAYLDGVYAEGDNYSNHLKKIISSKGL